MEFEHVAWCRKLYDMMHDGGTWAVPRSGLIFQKLVVGETEKLVLQSRMTWVEEMRPITADDLYAIQKDDYQQIQKHFKEAEIIVWDEHGLLDWSRE